MALMQLLAISLFHTQIKPRREDRSSSVTAPSYSKHKSSNCTLEDSSTVGKSGQQKKKKKKNFSLQSCASGLHFPRPVASRKHIHHLHELQRKVKQGGQAALGLAEVGGAGWIVGVFLLIKPRTWHTFLCCTTSRSGASALHSFEFEHWASP